MGRIFISLANVSVSYLIFVSDSKYIDVPEVKSTIPALVLVFIASLMMSSIVMQVYDSVSLCILQCLLADFDICD